MINLIEIKDKRIFFITCKEQFNEFYKAVAQDSIFNSILVVDNNFITDNIQDPNSPFGYYKVSNEFGRYINKVTSFARKYNLTINLICDNLKETDNRFKVSVDKVIHIKDETILYENLRTTKKIKFIFKEE